MSVMSSINFPIRTIWMPNKNAKIRLSPSPGLMLNDPWRLMRAIPESAINPAIISRAVTFFFSKIQLINGTIATYAVHKNACFALVVYWSPDSWTPSATACKTPMQMPFLSWKNRSGLFAWKNDECQQRRNAEAVYENGKGRRPGDGHFSRYEATAPYERDEKQGYICENRLFIMFHCGAPPDFFRPCSSKQFYIMRESGDEQEKNFLSLFFYMMDFLKNKNWKDFLNNSTKKSRWEISVLDKLHYRAVK